MIDITLYILEESCDPDVPRKFYNDVLAVIEDNSRLGWYRRCGMYVVNYALSPEILGRKTKDRPGLVD